MYEAAGLILPVLALIAAAAVVPRLLARRLGRGAVGYVANAALSGLFLTVLAGLLFLALYQLRDPQLWPLIVQAPGPSLLHFARLGAEAGLIWAPVLALSLVSLPRHGAGRG